MPENDRKLTLHSPAGSEHAVYRWPLTRSVRTVSCAVCRILLACSLVRKCVPDESMSWGTH